MDEGIFGTTVKGFDARYVLRENPHVPQAITGYRRLDEMTERLAPYIYEVQSRDVLDLPPESDSVIRVVMSAKGRRAYDEMERTYAVELEDGEVTADGMLPKLLRLAQMTGGTMEVDGVSHHVDDQKESALRDWLCDVDEPVVIVCRFKSDIQAAHRAAASAGHRTSELSGAVNGLDEWQDGRSDVLVMQISAGNVGISLIRARLMVMYSVGYSLTDISQARGRVLRPGQARPVQYIHFVMDGTIDESIAQAHMSKGDVVAAVRAGIRARR